MVDQQRGLLAAGFYLWGCVKSTVYCAEASDMQDLLQRIENVCAMIRTKPGILQRLRQQLCRCKKSCFELCTLCENFL